MPTLIDPQQIYPKRMGIHRGSLVIQYYNLQVDKFKKHLIPINHGQNAQKNLQNILKTAKHSVFLKKVAPQNLKKIISRIVNHQPLQIPHSSSSAAAEKSSFQDYSSKRQSQNINQSNTDNFQSSLRSKHSLIQNSLSYSADRKNKNIHNNDLIEDSYGYSMNFEEELSISIAKRKEENEKANQIQQQIIQNYDDDFQDFEAEQGQQQQPLMKDDQKQEQLRILDEKRRKQKQKEQEKQKQKQRKEAEKRLKKQFKQFDFIDDDDEAKKKKKKKKKDKSKSKQKKDKSKKSQDTSKNTSNKGEEQVPIEQQFDFL